jgi:ATP phosphoribosyltransferase
MQQAVSTLLSDAGIRLQLGARAYRPTISLAGFDVKILKPQNIVEMLGVGLRDVGFAGADWVAEMEADVVELLDTGLDPVRLVAAAPAELTEEGSLPRRPLVVASEYQLITRGWIERAGLDATLVRSYGATEVFPPEDADCIVDNTATGATLRANNLHIIEVLMTSSTRLYASRAAMADEKRREKIESFVLLLESVFEARRRVMLEVNVAAEDLERIIEILPCMREPTISELYGNGAYGVKAAVPRELLPGLIPRLKKRGGTDVVVTNPYQIVP